MVKMKNKAQAYNKKSIVDLADSAKTRDESN